MTTVARRQQAIRFRGRSLMAFVLEPTRPLDGWLGEVADWLGKSPGFFNERPVLLGVKESVESRAELVDLVAALARLGVRVMGLEGARADWLTDDLPPAIAGGRGASMIEVLPQPARRPEPPKPAEKPAAAIVEPAKPVIVPAPRRVPVVGLVIDQPVRSGQTIVHEGDVTVVGSVASGAEIVAGGSIHVYGTLRGRAVAGTGASANGRARIFARRFEAELVAIDGVFRTAEELGAAPRGHMVQVYMDGDALVAAVLD